MLMAELKAVVEDIESQVGKPRRSNVPRGGDLFVYPTDENQQALLIELKQAAGRSIKADLPKTSSSKKGVIFGVPIHESEEDLLQELASQGVTKVERFHKGTGETRTALETVALYFEKKIPDRVTIVAMSFTVKPYLPTPFLCKNCWRLGHTPKYCPNTAKRCKNCGEEHDDTTHCSTKCVNCSSKDHQADSKLCPAFKKMQAIIKLAVEEDISIRDARFKYESSYSAVTRKDLLPTRSPSPTASSSQEFSLLKSKVEKLQEELKEIKESSIKGLYSNYKKLNSDLEGTKRRVHDIETTFMSRFDNLEQLIIARLPVVTQPNNDESLFPPLPSDEDTDSQRSNQSFILVRKGHGKKKEGSSPQAKRGRKNNK